MQVPAAPTVPPAWQGYRSQFVPPLLEFRAYIQAYAEAVFRNDPFQRKFKSWSIQKQNRKHCEVRLPTSIEEAGGPGAVLPLGGAVAPVAPMCANAGQFWRADCRTAWFGVYWGDSAGALRVMTRCP